jgi:diguanylate cyclase (GGDEF)-like protein/PAS domain S-box-containing protein
VANINQDLLNTNIKRLDIFFDAAGVGIWDWNIRTGELIFNEPLANIVGHSIKDLKSVNFRNWLDNMHPEDSIRAEDLLEQHFNDELNYFEIEARMKHKSGHYVWVSALGKLVERDDDGKPHRMIGSHRDITLRKNNEEQITLTSQLLKESQQLGKLGGWKLDLKTDDVVWTDETYRIHETSSEEFNPTVETGLNYYLPESKAILSKALYHAINNGIDYDLELESYTTKGKKIDVRTTCTVSHEKGVPVRLSGIFQDISDRKINERKLEKNNLDLEDANSALKLSTQYDPLTGLPNKKLLTNIIDQVLIKSFHNEKHVAIVFIDLDGFKQINDIHGHNIGDELLKKAAKKLTSVLREGDILSRIGDNEFVAVIDQLSDPSESHAILSRMLKSVSGTLVVQKKLLKISASIGVTFYPLDDVTPDQLIRHADHAMYIAKQTGRSRTHVFDIEKDVAEKHHNVELIRIAQALTDDEFLLYYQPKVDLRTNEVVGVEALIRWDHPDRGLLTPASFLPEVENDMLGVEIGRWVITTALQQLQYWLSLGYDIPISINISPLHLQHASFVSELKDMLNLYPTLKAGSIEFEIVETSALKDIELVSSVIQECNQLGVLFSIDDFGTGYSSLTYLRRLPADSLKIDQSFVINMLTNTDDKAIIQGIIELAKVFNLTVIAEGVETPEHGQLLLALGSYIAQGYGIAKPMSAKNILTWLVTWKNNPCLVDGTV